MFGKLSAFTHTIVVLGAILLAFTWLSIPQLSYYSLQAFALATFGFFVSKRLSQAKIWHILPQNHSIELAFISFAVTLLIGATGNTESVFYPFAYIHLFFLVMTARQNTAIAATAMSMVAHYALEPTISSHSTGALFTLPLMLVFFLFARRQYDDARLQHKIVEIEEEKLEEITKKELTLESFIRDFLKPKLLILQDLLETSRHRNEPVDSQAVESQISLLANESQKALEKITESK